MIPDVRNEGRRGERDNHWSLQIKQYASRLLTLTLRLQACEMSLDLVYLLGKSLHSLLHLVVAHEGVLAQTLFLLSVRGVSLMLLGELVDPGLDFEP